MPVRTERRDRILTVVLSRPEARNAVDPEHADALHEAFVAFDHDETVDVAVLWGEGGAFCAGADLKKLAARDPDQPSPLEFPKDGRPVPRGPLGPTRLRLGKPVIAALEGPAVAGGMELALWADCRVLSSVGSAPVRRRDRASAKTGGERPCPRDHHDGTEGGCGRMLSRRLMRKSSSQRTCARRSRSISARDCAVSSGLCTRRPAFGVSTARLAGTRGAAPGMGELQGHVQGRRGNRCGTFCTWRRTARQFCRALEVSGVPGPVSWRCN
jgi:hypothetical protein